MDECTDAQMRAEETCIAAFVRLCIFVNVIWM